MCLKTLSASINRIAKLQACMEATVSHPWKVMGLGSPRYSAPGLQCLQSPNHNPVTSLVFTAAGPVDR